MQLPCKTLQVEAPRTLEFLLQRTVLPLWEDWPRDMKLSSFDNNGFVVNGECPHCRKQAAFVSVTPPYEERDGNWPTRMIGAARCIAGNEYILAILEFELALTRSSGTWKYQTHYPIGWPDDRVAEDIPDSIKPDFREALRCRWVNAYNATVEMCRRALEASCLEQGAPAKLVLNDMIDWVHAQGKITTPLKDMAHKIKLGGNRGAHPSDKTISETDADAVIEFTREYFQHVYVMPARMEKFDFSKAKPKKP